MRALLIRLSAHLWPRATRAIGAPERRRCLAATPDWPLLCHPGEAMLKSRTGDLDKGGLDDFGKGL